MFFFITVTSTTQIYTLSLHDALPISVLVLGQNSFRHGLRSVHEGAVDWNIGLRGTVSQVSVNRPFMNTRSEEHTSELQSRLHIVCRLLLEKKKNRFTHRAPSLDTSRP